VTDDCLKLTTYFGERDRAGDGFLADALTDIFARHELRTSLVMRGVAGFGLRQHVRTDRLLTLSEDLPVVSVAVDERSRVQRALEEVSRLAFDGLVTLERARMLIAPPADGVARGMSRSADTKLTVYVGRHDRIGGRPAYEALVAFLHDRGVAGATVLLGVDGTAHGIRQRARFFAANASVPLMVIAVGDGARVDALTPELLAMLDRPLVTVEAVRVCKRDGLRLAEPTELPDADPAGLAMWQKLMVYSGEQARADGEPIHLALVRALRREGCAGATCLRGIWGYHGDHAPHGDRLWQLRRRVPIVTVVVDTPARVRRLAFPVVDALTRGAGLVTSEMVPAYRSTAGEMSRGGLRLAARADSALGHEHDDL
jgi:PII-like signaling protein